MKTDVKETDQGYELEMDLPGFAKDEIRVSLENGYMTISAAKGLDQDEKEKDSGRYIRRERYAEGWLASLLSHGKRDRLLSISGFVSSLLSTGQKTRDLI